MTPEEEQYLRNLGAKLEVMERWEVLTGTLSGAWEAAPDSELAKDDEVGGPFGGVSNGAWSAATAAISHLGCLRDSLFQETGPNEVRARIHTHGQLTLIRGGLENASMAVWLLEDDDRSERVLRRLQTDWEERRELDKVASLIGAQSPRTMDEHFADLSSVAQRAGFEPNRIKRRPGYGEIVKAAGMYLPGGPDTAFFMWKACSSIAHGEMRGSIAYLRSVTVGSPTPDTALNKITGNIQLMAFGGLMALSAAKKALDLYAKRAGKSEPV